MAASTLASGTIAAASHTLDTEYTISTNSTAGVFEFNIGVLNLAAGETVTLKVYKKVLTGDTTNNNLYASAIYSGTNLNTKVATLPFVSMFEYRVSLEQSGGTKRNYPWSIIQLDA